MAKKGHLKAALTKHNSAQQLKAKQRAADEARERKHASIVASSNGAKGKTGQAAKRVKQQQHGAQEVPSEKSSVSGLSAKKQGKQRQVEPFALDDTILLVGEGNFSFALSLLSPPRSHPPALLLATSYDDESTCYTKYPDAKDIVATIRKIGNRDDIVRFGVDAGNLQACKAVVGQAADTRRRWSKIYFGFPHVGAGHKDEMRNVLANQLLLARFFVSAAPLLTQGHEPAYAREESNRGSKRRASSPCDESDGEDASVITDIDYADEEAVQQLQQAQSASNATGFLPPSRAGSILITLRNAHPYTLWDVPMLGKRLSAMLPGIAATAPPLPKGVRTPKVADIESARAKYRLWRSFEFLPGMWKHYSHRRTIGWVEGLSTSANEDILRQGVSNKGQAPGKSSKHAGTGECRTWEFGLVP
ncbi:hypothetical protein K437DRAFT_289771 [Tilletiaria anomala UBC 951]|uniref:25S rRNA (uridine-N(3))-methyltransferase BMT5-like domain-containing protein n=1 Tax=Tilletiaria anomala (strain ATCC 24038 / CBS 436.72 / UBC 951) TaxID=1037660 RepID=A0A066WJT2_TILAU|nr:uncharacterized protein K437DRAFT_289771 [Tilletiaria anomala UBC 951]KDN52813.1 hypothetical protein K437DRAFT_289771 [Tilletiaria anomala UBC 951]